MSALKHMSIHASTSPNAPWHHLIAIVAMMSDLAACGSTPHPADSEATNQPAATSQAIDLPPLVDHFQRTNILRRNDVNDVTAGCEFGNDADMVIAIMRVRTTRSDENLIPLLNAGFGVEHNRIGEDLGWIGTLPDAGIESQKRLPQVGERRVVGSKAGPAHPRTRSLPPRMLQKRETRRHHGFRISRGRFPVPTRPDHTPLTGGARRDALPGIC
jgi:hypothetical protein